MGFLILHLVFFWQWAVFASLFTGILGIVLAPYFKRIKDLEQNNVKWFEFLLLGLFLLLLTYLSLTIFWYCSWVIILVAATAYMLYAGFLFKKTIVKILFLSISAVFFAFFIFELYLWITKPEEKYNIITTGTWDISEKGLYNPNHPYLGFGLNKDGSFTSKKTLNNEVLFDVSYTIKNNLRFTPNSNEKSQNCALFFGCSFTFGEGLGDSVTLPFYFNKYAHEDYKILNYGLPSYGPNHMLALIENRVSKDIQGHNDKKIAIYSFIPEHIHRAAGFYWWVCGPRYEMIKGQLQKTGFFRSSVIERKVLSLSYIYNKFVYKQKAAHYDFIRTVEIIKKSNELLKKNGVILYVFIWNYCGFDDMFKNKNDYLYFLDEMKKNHIKTFFLLDAIPDHDSDFAKYSIPVDGHPNGLVNEKIAQYLYMQIHDSTVISNE